MMFITLFLKECKEHLKSITYYIFVACVILFFVTQMGAFGGVVKPIKGQDFYGFKYSNDENEIIKYTLDKLIRDINSNTYDTYPIGFHKEVKLDKEEENSIYAILENIIDIDKEQIKELVVNYNDTDEIVTVKNGITFQKFSDYMDDIDDILGGGSSYNSKNLYANAVVQMTYKDALKEYESIINNDKVSKAYARLFCDYMGIVLAILPVFLVVTRALKDKRAKAEGVIFSKKASSTIIILSRYLAMIVMILIPVILISITPALQSIYCANINGIKADYFAFIKGILGWLLPTILFTLSMGFVLTEITNGPIAILVQGLWWFLSLLSGASNLIGNVGMNLIPRFNELGKYHIYIKVFNTLVINRLGYSIAALVLIMFTVFIYDRKRKGKLNIHGKILKDS